jgi:pimeloyl-ACP methyl ester carboxylesterase
MLKSLMVVSLIAAGVVVVRRHGPEHEKSTVRNVVLVHGAYADGSSYAKILPLLRARGLNVTVVQNPLTSLADDVAATRRALARQDGPVILVGHSSAGVVITEAGNDPKVKGLVYISAIVPNDGQSAREAIAGYPATPGGPEQHADSSGYLTLTRRGVYEDFVPDLPELERELVYQTQGDWHASFLDEKVTTAAWKTRAAWSIIPTDRMVPVEHQEAAARRMHAAVVRLSSSHVPMLSHPTEVAAVIIEAAEQASGKAIAAP